MSVVWDIEPDEMLVQVAEQYATDLHRAAYTIAQRYAPEIEAWMKATAPWTDRTGNARQGLSAKVDDEVNQFVELIMAYDVEYGKYLEFDYGGRFAIIGPALDTFAPKIWADIQRLVS